MVSALLLGTLGILSITAELSTNTIRPTFAAMPDRWRPLLAKPILHVALADCRDGHHRGGGLAVRQCVDQWGAVARRRVGWRRMLVGIIVLAMLLTLFGYALGLAVRSTPLAICILLLWPLVVEGHHRRPAGSGGSLRSCSGGCRIKPGSS